MGEMGWNGEGKKNGKTIISSERQKWEKMEQVKSKYLPDGWGQGGHLGLPHRSPGAFYKRNYTITEPVGQTKGRKELGIFGGGLGDRKMIIGRTLKPPAP